MQAHRFVGFVTAAALIALAACSGGKKAVPTPPPTVASLRTAAAGAVRTPTSVIRAGAQPVVPTPPAARGGLPVAPTPPVGRPGPPLAPTAAVGRAGAPTGPTPAAGRGAPGAGDCTPGSLPDASDSFSPGTPVPRPAIDLSALTVVQQDVPSGYTSLDQGGFTQAERVTADDLARGADDPQAAADYMNTIGFLGGRQQGWNGPPSQGYVPTLYVQHLVFSSDAGARTFVNDPVIPPSVCFRDEPGPTLGQDTNHLFYQFMQPLTSGGTGTAEGHAIIWRCGRVVINVSGAGAPGTVSSSTVAQFAQKVQQEFVKVQPCA